MSRAGVAVGGRYRLEEPLASGGMGTVWRAWDERLQRIVAVKQLHLDPALPAAERDLAVARMLREARITAQLRHPNAVPVFDVIDDDGRPSLVMPFIPSRSLHQVLTTDGPLLPPVVARLGVQIAAALASAHRLGIVHRDVKPGNVLIDDEGVGHLTDFGIAHTPDDPTLTSTGMITGTPAYLAPEVARGAPSDTASDVWSLGATLYAAVEGHPPFGTEGTPMAVLHRVASGRPEAPRRSGELTPLLQAMLAADPAVRPRMVDVVDRLSRLTDAPTASLRAEAPTDVVPPPATRATPAAAPFVAAASAPPFVPPSAPARQRRRRPWLPVLAVALVAALAAVVAIVLLSGGGDGGPSAPPSTAPPGSSSAATRSSQPPSTRSTTSAVPAPPASNPGDGHGKDDGKGKGKGKDGKDAAAAPTAADLSQAITDYFTLVPGDLDAAWQRLTPTFQQQRAGGRASFDAYWRSIDHVDVADVAARPPSTVTATLTYHYADGRTVTDATTFTLVRQGGVLKIDSET
ncbi:MAG: serine/threonine-protein kinase [Jatrophihabitans sp.]|uniref:serine/threonine-protein kinase n=1 Tax=Jatrophihabitans sp. TaxID=1932789 RepID=UPI003F7EC9CA